MMAGLLGVFVICSGSQVPLQKMFARCRVEEVGRKRSRRVTTVPSWRKVVFTAKHGRHANLPPLTKSSSSLKFIAISIMTFHASKVFWRKTRDKILPSKPNPQKAASQFLKLPREIRDHIYTDIFADSSNAITLSPWSIEVTRSMAILRTCKQVQRECKVYIIA